MMQYVVGLLAGIAGIGISKGIIADGRMAGDSGRRERARR